MSEFEHENTEEIVCPWCGYESVDSWEFAESGEMNCCQCEKPFKYGRIIDVTYDTERVEPND